MLNRRAWVAIAFCAGLLAAEGPDPGSRTETRSEKLAFGAKLWVKNRNGGIKVAGWDKEEVSLTAQIKDSAKRKIELVVQHPGADLDIEARFGEPVVSFNFGFTSSPRCEMTLNVPRRVLAYFRTTNGSVAVTTLDGYARCETTNGDITLKDISGEVQAETTNGSVQATALRARIKGGTTNGGIRLKDVEGGVAMETTNGTVHAENLDGWGEGIKLESTNGDIDVILGKAAGEIHAENTNGSQDIKVPQAQVVELKKHEARVKVPGREQKILLETTNGGITVH